MKILKIFVWVLFFSFVSIEITQAQQSADDKAAIAAALKKLADGKTFVFKAIYANIAAKATSIGDSFVNSTPSGSSGHIFLKGDYIVTLKPDSIVSFLPFFGNNQIEDKPGTSGFETVTMNDNPSKFAALKYDYAVKQRKSGAVQITVTPQDNKAIDKFTFEIFPDKSVKLTLTIESNDSISYNGELIQ